MYGDERMASCMCTRARSIEVLTLRPCTRVPTHEEVPKVYLKRDGVWEGMQSLFFYPPKKSIFDEISQVNMIK